MPPLIASYRAWKDKSGQFVQMALELLGITDTLSSEYEKYSNALNEAGDAFKEFSDLLNSTDYKEKSGWKKEATGKFGEIVYTKPDPRGKFVNLWTELPADVELVFEDMWKGIDSLAQWNPNVEFARQIAAPTDNFDLCHYGNNDLFIITGRDMVVARVQRKIHDGYMVASRSVELPEYPERKDKVRAVIYLAGARIRSHPDDPEKTIVEAIMLGDAKGLIPTALVHQVLAKITLMDSKLNRDRFEELAANKKKSTKL